MYMDYTINDSAGEIKHRERFSYVLFTVMLFYFFSGSGSSWGISFLMGNFLSLSLLFVFFLIDKNNFVFSTGKGFLFLVFSLAILCTYSRGSNLNGYINQFLFLAMFFLVISLNLENKKRLLVFLTKWLAIALLISFSYYLLAKAGAPLPYSIYIPTEELAENGSMYVFKNYYLFTEFYYDYFNEIRLPRFQAFFTEPAYLGTICLLMIIANNFNFKNHYVKILCVMMVISASLAAYACFVYSFLLYLILCKKQWSVLFYIVFAVAVCFLIYLVLPEDDNVIDTYITGRLFDDNGFFLKYNRSRDDFNLYFSNVFLNGDYLWTGGDQLGIWVAAETKSVDYRFFLVHYGIIGLLLYLVFIVLLFSQHCARETFIFLSTFVIMLFQSSFLGQYYTYLAIVFLGTFILAEKNDVEQKGKQFYNV